jgi:hypothetical protein
LPLFLLFNLLLQLLLFLFLLPSHQTLLHRFSHPSLFLNLCETFLFQHLWWLSSVVVVVECGGGGGGGGGGG